MSTYLWDLAHNALTGQALKVAAYTATDTGTAVDCQAGDGHVHAVLEVGTVTDGTFALKMQESATSGGTYADITGATFAALV